MNLAWDNCLFPVISLVSRRKFSKLGWRLHRAAASPGPRHGDAQFPQQQTPPPFPRAMHYHCNSVLPKTLSHLYLFLAVSL